MHEPQGAVKALGPIIGGCMRQNNTIDIYEEYFDGDQVTIHTYTICIYIRNIVYNMYYILPKYT
jgi:hypothetical protein